MINRNMKHESNPFQKKRRKLVFVVLSVLSIALLITYFAYNHLTKEEPFVARYDICGSSQEEIVEKFTDYTFSDKQVINDYFFYGENLNLFEEEYNVLETHNLIGKTLLIKNVCTDDEFHYLIDKDVDGQIPLENLPTGMYEIFINVDMVKKRVVMNDLLEDELTLVKRGEGSRKVELIANKNMFDDKVNKDILNDNYLFLNVEASEAESDVYDVVIDPSLGTNESGFFNNYGANSLGMIEADELYSLAEMIKTELEKEGLKVLITRDNKEHIINSYGENGRLQKAYDSKAKYYIELNFNSANESGLKVTKSSYASSTFATFVANHLLENTDLTPINERGAVYSANRYNGLDGTINIRETGGKALAAATYSELAKESNSSFAYNNRNALEAISIEYLDFKNEIELENYKVNKETYAKETALALLEYFKLGVQNDISD